MMWKNWAEQCAKIHSEVGTTGVQPLCTHSLHPGQLVTSVLRQTCEVLLQVTPIGEEVEAE